MEDYYNNELAQLLKASLDKFNQEQDSVSRDHKYQRNQDIIEPIRRETPQQRAQRRIETELKRQKFLAQMYDQGPLAEENTLF